MDLVADIIPTLIKRSNDFRIKRHMNTYSVISVSMHLHALIIFINEGLHQRM